MKIVYITNVRIPTPRAQGYAIMKMCEQFGLFGNDVELLIPDRSDSDGIGEPFDYYKIERTFGIKKVFATDFLGKTLKFGRFLYWVDILTFITGLYFKKFSNKSDIIYTRDFLIPLIFSRNNFICLEVHDIPKMKFLFSYILRKPKMFFVLNKYLKNALMEFGVSESKIHIVPSGVDIKMFDNRINREDARNELGLPQEKKVVVYTGHFYSWKGVDCLAKVAEKMPDVYFIFVGGVEPELSNFKNRYSDQKNIIIRSFVKRELIPLYLKASDVLVLPNSAIEDISVKYTSPLKMFEYMASGTPIVASDLPSIREILNESNSVFAIPDDSQSLSDSIRLVLSNEELGSKISKQAKNDVVSYDWGNRAKTILEFMELKK